MTERRLTPRVDIAIPAFVSGAGRRRESCSALNVSSHGAFLETAKRFLDEGSPVELAFVVTRGTVARVVSRKGVVVRVTGEGVGVLFSGACGSFGLSEAGSLG